MNNHKLTKTLLAGAVGMAMSGAAVAADRGPAYQIIPVAELGDVQQFGPTPSAISADGNWIAAFGARFLMPDGFDETLRYVWNVACPYSTEVCSFQWNGFEGQDDGFRFYRETRLKASANGYQSNLLAFALESGDNTAADDPSVLNDSDKVTVFDVGGVTGSTDVMITAFNQDGSIMAGNETGPYTLEGSSWTREFVRRGFIADSTGAQLCELMPDLSNLPETDNRGGLSAVYGLTETVELADGQSHTIAVGLRDNGRPDGNWDAFNDCEFDNADLPGDASECPGFNTQATLWDITACLNGSGDSKVEGVALASAYLNAGSDDYPIANAHAINAAGIAVGASAYTIDNKVRDAAVVFETEADESGNLVPKNDQPVAIPMRSANGDKGPSQDFFEQIQNAWAVDINDNNQVVGNVYYAVSRNRNKAHEFFIYDYDTPEALASFPLRDDPIDGANSFANGINNHGLVVGWRDAAGDIRPSFLGSPRNREGFLFDSNSDSGNTYNLNDLLCSVENGQTVRPLYRILEAIDITDAGEILAKATRFASAQDWQDRLNGTPVVVKLQPDGEFVTQAADQPLVIDSVTCPAIEKEPFTRSGAAIPPWLLALLGLFSVFRFTKRKSFAS